MERGAGSGVRAFLFLGAGLMVLGAPIFLRRPAADAPLPAPAPTAVPRTVAEAPPERAVVDACLSAMRKGEPLEGFWRGGLPGLRLLELKRFDLQGPVELPSWVLRCPERGLPFPWEMARRIDEVIRRGRWMLSRIGSVKALAEATPVQGSPSLAELGERLASGRRWFRDAQDGILRQRDARLAGGGTRGNIEQDVITMDTRRAAADEIQEAAFTEAEATLAKLVLLEAEPPAPAPPAELRAFRYRLTGRREAGSFTSAPFTFVVAPGTTDGEGWAIVDASSSLVDQVVAGFDGETPLPVVQAPRGTGVVASMESQELGLVQGRYQSLSARLAALESELETAREKASEEEFRALGVQRYVSTSWRRRVAEIEASIASLQAELEQVEEQGRRLGVGSAGLAQ